MPAVCSSLYLERKHRLEYIYIYIWKVARAGKGDGQIGGRSYLVTWRRRTGYDRPTDRLPRVKTRARGKRKNENRRTDGRTLDKQGAIEINREYCEEYAQTRNTHSSSPSTFSSTPYLPILSLLYSSLSLPLSLLPIPSMSPFSLSFVRTRACSLFLTFVARLASAFTSAALLFFFVHASYPPRA